MVVGFQLPMQAVLIITNVVSSNPAQARYTRDIALCYTFCQWHAAGWCFSRGTPVSPINKTDRRDITEISYRGVKYHNLLYSLFGKTKICFPRSGIDTHSRLWLPCVSPLMFMLPKVFKLFSYNIKCLNVPDKGYSRKVSCALNSISTLLFVRMDVDTATY